MKQLFKKQTSAKSVRKIVLDPRAIKKAANASIKDQNKISALASKMRAQLAN